MATALAAVALALALPPAVLFLLNSFRYRPAPAPEVAIVGDVEQSGPRPPEQLAPYLALPEVARWDGDAGGGKGPTVVVYQLAPNASGPPRFTTRTLPL